MERVLESHVTVASTLERSIVRIGLETYRSSESETRIAPVCGGQVGMVVSGLAGSMASFGGAKERPFSHNRHSFLS